MAGDLQTILFDTKLWTREKAVEWLKKHKYKYDKLEKKPNFLRFQQRSVALEKAKGKSRFRTKPLPKGIEFILAF